MDIASPITAVKGIGEKTQKAFAKMGVYTVGDILLHFPRDYVKFPEITDIDELNNVNESSTYAIHAVIKKAPVVKNTARMQITLQDIVYTLYLKNLFFLCLARAYDTAGMVPYAIP